MKNILLLLTAAGCLLRAGVSITPDLRALSQQSDCVIVATIGEIGEKVNSVSLPALSVRTARLNIIRSLQGSSAVGAGVVVSWSGPLSQFKGTSIVGDVGLWFLKRNGDLSFSPVGLVSPLTSIEAVRISVDSQMSYVSRAAVGSPGEAALLEILNTEDRRTQPAVGYSYIHWGACDEWKPDLMREAYGKWAKESTPSRRAKGLAGLVRLGDAVALQTIAEESVRLTEYTDYVSFSLSGGYRSQDVGGLGALGKLTRAIQFPMQIRKSAAEALCSIHSKESIPYLEALLDLNSEELEMLGTAGLAMFANGVKPVGRGGAANRMAGGPRGPFATDETMRRFSMDPAAFHNSRAQSIAFWKAWLSANRAKIAAL